MRVAGACRRTSPPTGVFSQEEAIKEAKGSCQPKADLQILANVFWDDAPELPNSSGSPWRVERLMVVRRNGLALNGAAHLQNL